MLEWFFFTTSFTLSSTKLQLVSYPDLPAHTQTLRAQLFQKAGMSGRFCDVMMMWPGCGLARSPQFCYVMMMSPERGLAKTWSWFGLLAKPRPCDIIITSQNRPDLPAFWNRFEIIARVMFACEREGLGTRLGLMGILFNRPGSIMLKGRNRTVGVVDHFDGIPELLEQVWRRR